MSRRFQHRFKGKMNLIDKTGYITPMPNKSLNDASVLVKNRGLRLSKELFLSQNHTTFLRILKNCGGSVRNEYRKNEREQTSERELYLNLIKNKHNKFHFNNNDTTPSQMSFKNSDAFMNRKYNTSSVEREKSFNEDLSIIKPKIRLDPNICAIRSLKSDDLLSFLMNRKNRLHRKRNSKERRIVILPAINKG